MGLVGVALTIVLAVLGWLLNAPPNGTRSDLYTWVCYVAASILAVVVVLLMGLAFWLYGGLVQACKQIRQMPTATLSRKSDDLGPDQAPSIFFCNCDISENVPVVVHIQDKSGFRVLGSGILHSRLRGLARVVIDSPAPGSDEYVKKLHENNGELLEKLRVSIDNGMQKITLQGQQSDSESDA